MVGASQFGTPVGIKRVLRHVPVEIRRAVAPPHRTALERLLELQIGPLSWRRVPPAEPPSADDEIGSLDLVETGICIRQSLPRKTK
jgi:hypothetical protein